MVPQVPLFGALLQKTNFIKIKFKNDLAIPSLSIV